MRRATAWMPLLVLTAVPAIALAQQSGRTSDAGRGANRSQLEAQVRREFARAVKERVGLTDGQMARLGPITQRYAVEHRRLQLSERDTRIALQRTLRDTAVADTARVGQLLQRLIDVQKRRVELVESEQLELAAIMSPVQRARFMALQEQARRRVDQRRSQGGGPGAGGAPPRRGRPPL